jgi:hypothetical protein
VVGLVGPIDRFDEKNQEEREHKLFGAGAQFVLLRYEAAVSCV